MLQELEEEATNLIGLGISSRTNSTYDTALRSFNNFRRTHGLPESFPAHRKEIYLYVAYLSTVGYAASTVTTYLSAIAYNHKIHDMPDPTDSFVLKKMVEGYKRKVGVTRDKRRPISLELLGKILASLELSSSSTYECSLFRAAFALAFFGFLRIGEFAHLRQRNVSSRCYNGPTLRFTSPRASKSHSDALRIIKKATFR